VRKLQIECDTLRSWKFEKTSCRKFRKRFMGTTVYIIKKIFQSKY